MKNENKMYEFVVNVHPVKSDEDSEVSFGGAYVIVRLPNNIHPNYGLIQQKAEEYFKPLAEVKATEIRLTGYGGPM